MRWIDIKEGCKLRAREADDIFFPFTTLGALCFRTVRRTQRTKYVIYAGEKNERQYRANIGSQKVKGSWRLASTFWLTLPGGSCLHRPYCQSLQPPRARFAKKSASLARVSILSTCVCVRVCMCIMHVRYAPQGHRIIYTSHFNAVHCLRWIAFRRYYRLAVAACAPSYRSLYRDCYAIHATPQ